MAPNTPPGVPNLILTRPSIADQGQRTPSTPEQLYDPGLVSPFNTPPVQQDQFPFATQPNPGSEGVAPYQTHTPPRRTRGRKYPSQDGYTSPYTSPYNSPNVPQDGFTASRSRSGSPSASQAGSPRPPYLERMSSMSGYSPNLNSNSHGFDSPGSVTINLDTPPEVDPLDNSRSGSHSHSGRASPATPGTPTMITPTSATFRKASMSDVWHRHARNFSQSGGEFNSATSSRPLVEVANNHGRGGGGNSDEDRDDDDRGKDKKLKLKGQVWRRLVVRPLSWILPHSMVSSLIINGPGSGSGSGSRGDKNKKNHNHALSEDLRRKSTGTASATVRAKKQRARRGEPEGWVPVWVNRGNAGRFVLLLAVMWWMMGKYISPGSKVDTSSKASASAQEEGAAARKARLADPFHPKVGIYRNLPRHVVDEPPYHDIANGLLSVNTSAPVDRHPVYQLIKQARDEWDGKKKRQSKTLKQAVDEYRRRNGGLMPPKGFDKWWEFVVLNEVQLPDEYDQINKDLYLYRALSPGELNRRLDTASESEDTFTISIKHHNVRTRSTYDGEVIGGADERLEAQIELLMDYGMESWLSDMRVVYGIHDGPTGFIGYDHRSDLETLVQDDEYYRTVEELDTTVRGWEAACPYGSPARRLTPSNRGAVGLELGKTFVQDPTVSQFDICNHPEYMDLHGALNGRRPHVQQTLLPTFSLSKTALHTDVLGVPMEQWMESLPTIPWERKTQDKLLWRGSNTGAYYSDEIDWRKTHRVRLVELASGGDEMVDVIPPPRWGKGDDDDDQERDGDEEDEDDDPMVNPNNHKSKKTIREAMRVLTKNAVERKMLDIAFAGDEPIQCEESDGTCDQLATEYVWSTQKMTHEEALEYKYVVDVDGNTWSSRFQRLLLGGSVVFKSTIMPEWWNQRAQPWVHYVPVGLGYGDLVDALVFFRGGVDGKGGEDELARQIAEEGREWTETHWRKVDMAAYIGRVYLEWARLVAPVRRSMDFVYDESMEVELHDE